MKALQHIMLLRYHYHEDIGKKQINQCYRFTLKAPLFDVGAPCSLRKKLQIKE